MNPLYPLPEIFNRFPYVLRFMGTFDGVDVYVDDHPAVASGFAFVGPDGMDSWQFTHSLVNCAYGRAFQTEERTWITEEVFEAAKTIAKMIL